MNIKRPKMMSLEEAFAELYNSELVKRGSHLKFGMTYHAMHSIRRRFLNNGLSDDAKRLLLRKAGYKIVQEEKWV